MKEKEEKEGREEGKKEKICVNSALTINFGLISSSCFWKLHRTKEDEGLDDNFFSPSLAVFLCASIERRRKKDRACASKAKNDGYAENFFVQRNERGRRGR